LKYTTLFVYQNDRSQAKKENQSKKAIKVSSLSLAYSQSRQIDKETGK
jgi:hypothetical protein